MDKTPHGHWMNTTMISALRLDGSTADWVLEGATDTAIFHAYVQNVLAPTLRPGDIVVMDNLRVHKTPIVVQAIEATGATVRFPPAVQPRPQPNRENVVKGKGVPPQNKGSHQGHALGRHR